MTETMMTTRQERAEKRAQTLATKRAEHAAGSFPPRCWVRINDTVRAYGGLIGKVKSHNDLRTEQCPDIPVEIGVVFSPGNIMIWFKPSEMERSRPPLEPW